MRVFCFLAGAALLPSVAVPAAAQWPGELRGQVLDALSGRPVGAADVRLDPSQTEIRVDAGGRFSVRGLDPREYTLRVSALGYEPLARAVRVENGRVTEVAVDLAPTALAIEGVRAEVAGRAAEGVELGAEEIRRLGASTVADVVAAVPGALVIENGRGGPRVPTIRGSDRDAVLVLLDGVPVNDPVTGEADLSLIPAAGVSSVRVLAGARSARYGAGAEAGVVLVTTSAQRVGAEARVSTGSLGEVATDASVRRPLLGGVVDAGATFRRLDGGFRFSLPPEAGGGRAERENADARLWGGRLGWAAAKGDRRTDVRVGVEGTDRGMPGRSFAPSRSARQELIRARIAGSHERGLGAGERIGASGYFVRQRTDFADPAPPVGAPYDDRTTLDGAGGELRASRAVGSGVVAGGGALTYLRVESSQLASADPVSRTDAGAWASVTAEGPAGLSASASVRIDRAGRPSEWFASHDVGVRWALAPLDLRVGHRSSFSPPTLGDQFFRDGVGVAPNPDLEAERVPSEWVLGAAARGVWRGVGASLDVEAYRGDVDGMIVWLPDFRFVWSPRNTDVRRRGVDARGEVSVPSLGLSLNGGWSYNRATYVRPGPAVQVAYRPRFAGIAGATWSSGRWTIAAASTYTGARFPVPNAVNELPGFWATRAGVVSRWGVAAGTLEARLDVDRLLGSDDTLIFGFPDPGRTFRLSLRLLRAR